MKGDEAYLRHMLDACADIQEFLPASKPELARDRKSLAALVGCFQVLGETAKRVSDDFKRSTPQPPWREMTGMRDVLVHDYLAIDVNVVWNVAANDVPRLRAQLAALIEAKKP